MGNLIKAEFRKTLSLNLWWALAIPAFLAALVFSLSWGASVNDFNDFLGNSDAQELASILGISVDTMPVGMLSLGRAINIGVFFAVLFGVTALAGEYRNKTISTTFLTAPNRASVLSAKMITFSVWGLFYGVVAVAAASIGTAITVDSVGLPTAGQWLGIGATGLLAAVLGTLFGVGLGAVWNSVTGPTVFLCLWMLLIENILVMVAYFSAELDWLGGVLPNGALNGIVGAVGAEAFGAIGSSWGANLGDIDEDLQWAMQFFAGAPGAFSWWSSALIFLAWTMLFFGSGWTANQNRDIT
ncbi:ABC transporter permease subunit [Saccharomonospora sp. NB11]|jgi:ABC-2 type transport system permease protein|uniref:ABC transporter permease subunit n=1 Tax=Saccharomonospora sp. NB11 TaxID=1642298 RepID=UPI0018D0FE80|nr:ABC transporter permease subunit [Saccharomonospora sp. NB11]